MPTDQLSVPLTDDVNLLGPNELPLWLWAIYAALVVGVGLLILASYRLGQRRGRHAVEVRSSTPASGWEQPAVAQAADPAGADRASLVKGLIQAHDLAERSPAQQAHVTQVLQRVGVEMLKVRPGDRFDPSFQHAVDTRQTTDSAAVNTVIEVVRPGWREARGLIRTAEVSVWRN